MAMVVETRICSTFARFNTLNEDSGGACSSSVHLRCTVTVKHASRRLRGNGLAVSDRIKQPDQQPLTSDERRHVDDPSIFLGPDDTLRAVHGMLASVPRLRDIDLSPANWEPEEGDRYTLPQRVAAWLHEQGCRWLLGPGSWFRFEVEARLPVTVVFSDPRAVLRRCAEVAMQTVAPGPDEECGICLDEFRNAGKSEPVNLPCSHAFHVHCVLAWLEPASCGTDRRRWRR